MADLKKQIIFPKDAEFIAEDESNSGQDTPLQGPIYFDPDDVVLDQPNEKPEIQGVIHFDSDKEITNDITLAKKAINQDAVLRPITTQTGAKIKGTTT